MYEEEFRRIIEASHNNALTFFVGAGVSKLSGAPSWERLVDEFSEKLGLKREESGYSTDELLRIPQMYYSSKDNKNDYYNVVKRMMNPESLKTNDIHREMLKLDPVSFITTNYDTLLENSALEYRRTYKTVACDEEVPYVSGDRFILKAHGDLSHLNFVLKEDDYLGYSEKFKLVEILIKSIFSMNTVVFIGYGLNDYNIKLILNWVKSTLKDDFPKPLFYYTGNKLSSEELEYHKSRGLSVVEYYKLTNSIDDNDYLQRYKALFDAVTLFADSDISGVNVKNGLEKLYNRFKPLSKLTALRMSDIQCKIDSEDSVITEDRVLHIYKENSLFSEFLTICEMDEDDKCKFDKKIIAKYRIILDVFKKARIGYIITADNKTHNLFEENVAFANMNCILFDYKYMDNYVKKDYKSFDRQYLKAFYLFNLRRYDQAYELYVDLAKIAFDNKDYLHFYLCEANCKSLLTLIKRIGRIYNCYNLSEIESKSIEEEFEKLFERMPVDFRYTYSNLRDTYDTFILYKYNYEAEKDSKRLTESIDSNTWEMGLTSSTKATGRINDYLHFLQGNGLVYEIFVEYKQSVRAIMSALLYRYVTQDKEGLTDNQRLFENTNTTYFDEIDFYCFITCFEEKELKKLLCKYEVDYIYFHNYAKIEKAVNNVIDYNEKIIRDVDGSIGIIDFQLLLKRTLILLRYVDISQELADRVCRFILNNEFSNILISDKILFLDSIYNKQKKGSIAISKEVEKALISYIDRQMISIDNNDSFDLLSGIAEISYCNLIYYISLNNTVFYSKKISIRVSKIIDNEYEQMYNHIYKHYYPYVSSSVKKRVIEWAKGQLREEFNYNIFNMIVDNDAVDEEVEEELKIYLRHQIARKDARWESDNKYVRVFPVQNNSDIVDVGYKCFIGKLAKEHYKEFCGVDKEFDFFFDYDKFDFRQFDVAWLLSYKGYVLEKISENTIVKGEIRKLVSDRINSGLIAEPDKQRLEKILIAYFC